MKPQRSLQKKMRIKQIWREHGGWHESGNKYESRKRRDGWR